MVLAALASGLLSGCGKKADLAAVESNKIRVGYIGLTPETVEGVIKLTGNPRFAWDSYRRFIQMYSNVVLGMEHHDFEEILEHAKEAKGVELDTELDANDLKVITGKFKEVVLKKLGKPFPDNVEDQLWGGIGAVFGSWMVQRAQTYRRLNKIPGDWGTAVNVQAMVFGNRGETSATGVAFTRDPATGENYLYGEYLINAQGEDVVAGIRTPQAITKLVRERQGSKLPSMEESMPEMYKQLLGIGQTLEHHFKEMQDVEFTIQDPAGEDVELVQVEGSGPGDRVLDEVYPALAGEIVTAFKKSVLQ